MQGEDLDSFEVELKDVWDPKYTPFYFDRKTEYGHGHCYLESLCHAVPTRFFSLHPSYFFHLFTNPPPLTNSLFLAENIASDRVTSPNDTLFLGNSLKLPLQGISKEMGPVSKVLYSIDSLLSSLFQFYYAKVRVEEPGVIVYIK